MLGVGCSVLISSGARLMHRCMGLAVHFISIRVHLVHAMYKVEYNIISYYVLYYSLFASVKQLEVMLACFSCNLTFL